MSETKHDPESFSRAEYERRWQGVGDLVAAQGLDAIAVTAAHHSAYLAGTLSSGQMTSPVILTPGRPPVFVVRRFDEERIRVESPVQQIVSYFGEDDMIDVWAETLAALGLDQGRIGLELNCWGVTPHDVELLKRRLPRLQVVDASTIVRDVADVKSAEEIAAMRQAMVRTKSGVSAFYAALHEGVTATEAWLRVAAAILESGSSGIFNVQVVLGDRAALPHAGHSAPEAVLAPGGVAFTELSGDACGYFAGLVRTAVLGPNPAAASLHRLAEEALAAIEETLQPGVTTGDIDAAARGVVARAGRAETFRHRTGYSIGCRWDDRGSTSIKPGGDVVIRSGMAFHTPIILVETDAFCLGCSETWLVTDDGCEALSALSREMVRV